MSGLLLLWRQKANPPQDILDQTAFQGRTVLITGATRGLGLEAAKKVIQKGAKKLIITARDVTRGEDAIRILQDIAKVSAHKTEVCVLSLNMSYVESVQTFVEGIKTNHSDLDTAILNAGAIYTKWATGKGGFEETVQVNTISTTLLGLLLLPILEHSSTSERPAHLTFVSSGLAIRVKPRSVAKFANTEVLKAVSDKQNWSGGQAQYARSKLLLEYSMRHIASLPRVRTGKGEIKVIVNSICPGMCKSDLGREFKTNMVLALLMWLFFSLFARTAEQGSRAYLSAINQGADSQGQLWKDDRFYEGGEMIGTPQGDELANATWNDLVRVLEDVDPQVKSILEGK